jgi:hypothetical protein
VENGDFVTCYQIGNVWATARIAAIQAVKRTGLAEAIVPDDLDRIRETIRSFSAQWTPVGENPFRSVVGRPLFRLDGVSPYFETIRTLGGTESL